MEQKRQLLWALGWLAVAFAFFAAVNASQPYVSNFGGVREVREVCDGFEELDSWFEPGCADLLPARLAVLTLGLGVLLVCRYFANKDHVTQDVRSSSAHHVRGPYTHDVWQDPSTGEYWCRNCSFLTRDIGQARAHKRVPLDAPKRAASSDVSAPSRASSPTRHQMTPPDGLDRKTCPDCAEQVLAAARKCRFCGFRFPDAQG